MKTKLVSRLKLSLLVASPLVATTLGFLLAKCFSTLDRYVFSHTIEAFDGRLIAEPHSYQLEILSNVLLAILLASGSVIAAYTLGFKASAAALLQIVVLGVLCQWILWNGYSIELSPLALLIAIIFGFLNGKALNQAHKFKQTDETRQYALQVRDFELQRTRLQLIKQDEVERRLLAADLHDQVLNDLKVIKQNFFAYQITPSDEVASKIESLVVQVIEEIHEVMDSLCPSILEHLGLSAAIDECLRRAASKAPIKARFNNHLSLNDLFLLSTTEQSLIYRLVQESVTNACKHANAKNLNVRLSNKGDNLVVQVIDDGQGIDPLITETNYGLVPAYEETRGIHYMKQRANLIGATISWRSGDNQKGTLVEIQMNLAGKKNAKYINS